MYDTGASGIKNWRRDLLLCLFAFAFLAASFNFFILRDQGVSSATVAGGTLKKVTYVIATADLNVTYPYVTLAKALGYFQEEGLDVTIVPGQSTATTIQLLLTRKGDVGVCQPNPVMIQRANNDIPLVSVYPVSRRGNNIVITPVGSPIRSFLDLRGKIIGVPDLGSGAVIDLSMKLREVGLSLKDVRLISTGYGVPGYRALANGAVDASVSRPVDVARQEREGYRVTQLPETSDKMVYSFNIFAREDYIAENPLVIAAIGRATTKATIFAKLNPEAAVRVFWKQYPDRAPKDLNDKVAFAADLALIKAQLSDLGVNGTPVDFAWGSQTANVYEYIQRNLVATGLIRHPVDPKLYFTSQFEKGYVDFDRKAFARHAEAVKS